MIRSVTLNDTEDITNIYNYYVKNTVVSLEETPVEVTYFEEKINKNQQQFPWFVFEENKEIIGYAYVSAWKDRSAYKNTAEISIYLKENVTKKGIGSQLYNCLLKKLILMNFHTIIGGISLPNELSVRLHEKFGFEKVAHFKEVGFKFNKWVDVGYWQLIINK